MGALEVVVGLAILVGIVGIIVPVLPGVLLIAIALFVWAYITATTIGWAVLGVAVTILLIGQVVKYLIPGRQLRASVPTRTLLLGAVGAVIGFVIIPVVGVLIGFPLGVYVAERLRVGGAAAATSTKRALKAVGLSILIELFSAVLAVTAWVSGVLVLAS